MSKAIRRGLSLRTQSKIDSGTAAMMAEVAFKKAQIASRLAGACLILAFGTLAFVVLSIRHH